MPPSGRATPVSGARRQSMLPPPVVGDVASSVKVVVRIRPNTGNDASAVPLRFQRTVVHPLDSTALEAENAGPSTSSIVAATPGASGVGKYGKTAFTFDRVISPEEGQRDVYNCAESLVSSFLDGMNATILAYGQTSSGKSYTMGTDRLGEAEAVDDTRQGITPRAVAEIFERLNQAQRTSHGGLTFTAKVSYVEIYNEDLIDLLAGDADVRPTVQIREDKSGHIVWQGLREVKVSSAAEVMNLLAEGSTLRQTGSTEMNSQSSRSHAIFSLTVTQRKWAGPTPPPAPSPQPPATPRSGSRMSMLPRSPTAAGRSTPTIDRPASRSGLRPPSQLGYPISPSSNEDGGTASSNGIESWTTLTSKFHFVDLAGSERLKRTAAVGARAKEGIQINQGLSTLGNVISALGDPSKKATHIPYRDSKLTRLLQDSLGGNSYTMMIACVSPTEYNLHETLSTLKYANRARNIKNRAEINEVEAGWDNIEYLHRTITKLRADLAAIRSGDGQAMSAIAEESVRRSIDGGPTSTEAQLQQKVAQLTADLVKAESTATSSLSRDQFTSAVEPIVEEYERSLSALESQLALTRAALGHSEDEMHELEARVEEEVKANETNSQLIDELRHRVAKLSERESTTEAYVRDLELKLKDVDDAGDAHGVAVADLRKELARNREQAETTELYVKDVEARLARADEANAALKRQVEVLEREIERREEAHRELEARVSLLDTTNESKLLLAEIDEKDRRLLELERALDDLKTKADSAEGEAQLLQRLAEEEKAAKEELESQVRTLERTATVRRSAPDTPPRTPGDSESSDTTADAERAGVEDKQKEHDAVVALQARVEHLQAVHEEMVAQLDTAKGKYQDSLREIADLSAQVQESKLLRSQQSMSDMSDGTSPASATFPNGHSGQRSEEAEDDDEVEELASVSSRTGGSRSNSPNLSRTTPRTPHARRSMPLSPQHSRLSFLGPRGAGAASPSQQHLRSASLSQEFSLAAFSHLSSPPSPRPVSPSPNSRERPASLYGVSAPLSMPPATSPGERSYEQVKEEVLKLQTALTERETEISELESTIQQLRTPTIPSTTPLDSPVVSVQVQRSATPPPQAADHDRLNLSPRTLATFQSIKAGLNGTGLGLVDAFPPDTAVASSPTSPSDDTASHGARLDDLMRSMAQKETTHREAIEDLEEQLATLQRQHDELTVLSRDQVTNMSTEIEQLRVALAERPEKGVMDEKLEALEAELAKKGQEIEAERERAERGLEKAKREITEEHQRLLESTMASYDSTLSLLRAEHSAALNQAVLDRDETLKQRDDKHQSTLAALIAKHDEDLLARSGERDSALQGQEREIESRWQAIEEKHSAAVNALQSQHASALEERERSHSNALSALQEGHAAELTRAADELSARHAAELESLRQGHADDLEAMKTAHSAELASVGEEHSTGVEQAIADLSSRHAAELDSLRSEHANAFEKKERLVSDEIANLKEGHAADLDRAMGEVSSRHAAELDALREEHFAALEDRERSHAAALSEQAETHSAGIASLRDGQTTNLEQATSELSARHASELAALRSTHQDALTALRSEHEQAFVKVREEAGELEKAAAAREEDLRKNLAEEQEAVLARTREEHAAAVDEKEKQHQAALEACRRAIADEHASAVDAIRSEHSAAVDNLRSQHADELEQLRSEHFASSEKQQQNHAAALASLSAIPHHSLKAIEAERDEARSALDSITAELNTLREDLETNKAALAASSAQYDEASQRASTFAARFETATAEIATLKQSLKQHERTSTSAWSNGELQEALDALGTLEKALRESQDERERLLVEVTDLKGGEAKGRTKYDSMFRDLEQYRQSVTKLDLDLVTTRKERDSLRAQLARASLSSSAASAHHNGLGISSPTTDAPPSMFSRTMSPTQTDLDRATSPPLRSERFLSNGSSYAASFANGKPPPPTPPPSVPPPPAPLPNAPLPPVPQGASPLRTTRSSSLSSTTTVPGGRSSISGETPATSVRSNGSISGPSSSSTPADPVDPRVFDRLRDQDSQIARLTKQLAQKEADLQAQVDLGNTLDQALNDSERNLRKARLQSNEYARERDQFKADAERLRMEAQDSHSTSESYRQSVLDLETRLQHERDVQLRNERARQDMESRMNEMNRRPKSKFACF
ncbi:hypothetical protein JCM11251_004368 [Rhodosporidiobolus azoricus]